MGPLTSANQPVEVSSWGVMFQSPIASHGPLMVETSVPMLANLGALALGPTDAVMHTPTNNKD
eukprot:9240776-Pyramimonas_sp.AAC.2